MKTSHYLNIDTSNITSIAYGKGLLPNTIKKRTRGKATPHVDNADVCSFIWYPIGH